MAFTPLHPVNQQEFYRSIAGLVEPARLQSRRVAVIGLGSGGARVAAELGRLGIELLLVERPGERLEEHNILRHVLGYGSLGKPKLEEMLRYLPNLNPSTRLEGCPLDVVQEAAALEQRLQSWHPDLLAVCTDTEQSKHAVNELAVRLGIPQTGAGVYDGGIGGEVYRVQPGQACYGCIAEQLQLQRHTPKPPAAPDYNHLDLTEVPTTPALSLDIEQIALLHSRLCLEGLLGEQGALTGLPPEVNLWVFANRVVPGTFKRPLHAEFFRVPRQTDCLVCGKAAGDFDREAEQILAAVGQRPKAEIRRPKEGRKPKAEGRQPKP